MPFLRAPTRTGLFALLLGVTLISLFASLFAADRALATADRQSVELDAHAAALIVERELRLEAARLSELLGPPLVQAVQQEPADSAGAPSGFDAVWVLDARGGIVRRHGANPTLIDSLTVARAALEAIPRSSPRVRVVYDRDTAESRGRVLLAVSLSRRGQAVGSAVGLLSETRILAMLDDTVVHRPWTTLLASGRAVTTLGARHDAEAYLAATSVVRLPGDALEVEVAHAQIRRTLRTIVWLLGTIALVALLVGLDRERQQAVNLAGRTAELERLYEEVARSNRMKSEFLANVSHELRTPLNAIVGFVEMLREGVYGELTPRQALPVDRIAASATHLRHLVDRLLDIAKIAAGRLEIHAEPLVLRPFVLNVASEMESLVSERGLSLSIGVAQSLPRIKTDQTHLRQILINLIGNAVKYTPSGGINVRARIVDNGAAPALTDEPELGAGVPPDPTRPWVALQVADTGVGIAEADLERIFDEFEQVNAGPRSDSARRGTGLGLAISRRLARLLGGDLTVASEVGRGSTFTVWLPLDAADRRVEAASVAH